MQVSIIIPNWNGKHLLEKNLIHVVAALENKKNNVREILIVDDASTDDSVSFLKKQFKGKVRLITHTKNRGFAQAVNTGARLAKSEILCLLNTDVIPSINFLESVVPLFKNAQTFAVGFHEEGHGPATGTFTEGYLAHRGANEARQITNSLWASGGSAAFSRKLWWELGGLDSETFAPFYWEDVDLSYRAWKRGYKVVWDPNAHVLHKHEGSINTSRFRKKYLERIKERNELLFIWKNITSDVLTAKHRRAVLNRIRKHPGYIRIVYMAWLKKRGVLKMRAKEKREATLSDETVFSFFNS